ncbi:cytochrome b2 [Hortaea werneckii]|nr:cytochrome b2 [Hortaea werneckii]KAI7064603.1 cytochrome b2 [Hortaea werneckii]KAI7218011.1 cytochrome b2 [Hortaea werneckii]KAI7297652.1 cytochrome b2 [Hortaea werneckii]KAI7384871.1 cytochrome b2 [Hortaea werneckii]
MAAFAGTAALNEQIDMGHNDNRMIRSETYSRSAAQATKHVPTKPALSSIISVHEFEDVARHSFSEKAFAFYSSAATDLVSHTANLMCQRKLLLRPKILRNVKDVTTKRSILGSSSIAPFFFSPAAMATLAHEEGELAVARACGNEGIIQMVSSNASYPLANIVHAGKPGQPFFLQLYVNSDRSKTEELLLFAKKLGIKAILLTVDAPVPGKREADERIAAGNVSAAISGAVATNDKRGGGLGRGMGKYIDSTLCWEDLAWIKRVSGLPLVLKGIQTASDACKAVKFGAEGILLSNHGGRSLDTTQPAMMTLLELHKCAPEVFTHLEVYVDGGFTRGTDILKAIALGATAVGIGRPWLYALTYGQEGVEHLCDILKDELVTSMKLSGITDVDEAHPGMSVTRHRLFSGSVYNSGASRGETFTPPWDTLCGERGAVAEKDAGQDRSPLHLFLLFLAFVLNKHRCKYMHSAFAMSSSLKRKRSEVLDAETRPPPPSWSQLDNESLIRPDNSKKVATACKGCRKQKIKCELRNDEPPCARCHRKGLECILHIPNRTATEDHKQINLLGKDMLNVHDTLERICQHLGIRNPDPLASYPNSTGNEMQAPQNDFEQDDDGVCELSPPASPSAAKAPIDSYLTSLQETSPAGTSPQKARRNTLAPADMVTKGVISVESANLLVEYYLRHLDRFLYSLAGHYKCLDDVRRSSPALLAAMCTVAAFQKPESSGLFDICNREYRHLVSTAMFEKRNQEFIRALCIGSFWLPNSSRILASDAIRRSADCRLPRSYHQLNNVRATLATTTNAISETANHEAADRVRLWYLLFVSDQQLFILHNRDCIMHADKDIIEGRDLLLSASKPTNDDVRLISQVSLLVIMGQIKAVFSSDEMTPVPKMLAVQLNHFSRELDQWHDRFSPLFEADPHIGGFPLAGLKLHHQFGRLYLGHHVLRGLQKTDPIPLHFQQAALTAREAAGTIFSMILENDALRANIVGMPHYFHIMISFAGHFSLEVCMKFSEQLGVNVHDEFTRISSVLAFFAQTNVVAQHPLARVTTGLMRKLSDCSAALGVEGVLAGSPFSRLEGQYAAARDFGLASTSEAQQPGLLHGTATPFDWQALPTDFLYTDFADFDFADTQFDFVT